MAATELNFELVLSSLARVDVKRRNWTLESFLERILRAGRGRVAPHAARELEASLTRMQPTEPSLRPWDAA